jgi:hypothetical protein
LIGKILSIVLFNIFNDNFTGENRRVKTWRVSAFVHFREIFKNDKSKNTGTSNGCSPH